MKALRQLSGAYAFITINSVSNLNLAYSDYVVMHSDSI
jgi:hypothetical protein